MFSKNKFYIGIGLLIQAVVFVAAFFAFRRENKGFAGIILALGAASAAAGAVMLYRDRKEEARWRRLLEDPELFCDVDFGETADFDELLEDEE